MTDGVKAFDGIVFRGLICPTLWEDGALHSLAADAPEHDVVAKAYNVDIWVRRMKIINDFTHLV